VLLQQAESAIVVFRNGAIARLSRWPDQKTGMKLGRAKERKMDHIYPVTEIYGSSPDSIDQAIRNAIGAANNSIRNLDWFEVTEIRGHVNKDGSVGHFQVGVKLGFRLDQDKSG
jgi:hypothetical protein